MVDERLLAILSMVEAGQPTAGDVTAAEIRYCIDNELVHGGIWVASGPVTESGYLPNPIEEGQEYPTTLAPKGVERLRELRKPR